MILDTQGIALSDLQSDMRYLRQRISTLEAQNNVILRSQEKIMSLLSSRRAEDDLEFESSVTFPLGNIEALTNLDLLLIDHEKRKQLTAVLCSCAMETHAATTRNVLRKLFTTQLARKINWIGQRNTQKVPFAKKENLLKVIHGE